MTKEEKAKAYDEALKKAKEIKSKILSSHLSTESCKAVSEYIDEIIPELAESENEKIRKTLIDALKVSETVGELKFRLPEPTREEAIAYLEKLKEQKPVDYLDKDKVYAIMTKLTNLSYSQLIPINSDEFKKLHEITSDVRDLLDYPIEQKPAEWSEEDKQWLSEVYFAIDHSMYSEVERQAMKEYIDFLRSQSKPKQEWSEEDEKMIKRLITRLNWITYNTRTDGTSPNITFFDEIAWLKSLRPQSKQKQQIKEGDKVSIHCRKDRKEDIITFYDGKVGEVIHVYNAKKHPWGHIIVKLDNGCNDGFYEDEIEVLDEPSWKPSEEDIKMLEHIIGQYETGNKNSKVMGYLPRVEELSFLKKVLSKWKN